MTDERKPETPGMAEVSPKFVDEAEAAVAAETSTDEALAALWQEHKRLRAQYSEAIKETDLAFTAKKAITETETSEYDTAAGALETTEQRQREILSALTALETRITTVPAHTAAGVLVKLRVASPEIGEEVPLSALADLERLARTTLPEDSVLALKREWEARYKALDEQRDDPAADDSDEAVQPFFDRLRETEIQILRTQATTPAGIAVKLILWARLHCDADEVSGLSWTRKSIEGHPHDLDRLPVLSALLDLEHMAQGTVPTELYPKVGDGMR